MGSTSLHIALPSSLPRQDGLLLGFRPSETSLVADPTSPAFVDVIEPLGGESLVHVTVDAPERPNIVAQLREPIGLRAGDRVAVIPEIVHCFDAQSTRRVA